MLIDSLGLNNFKCFDKLNVNFAPITLLTGANSSGKSSLINAILAVLQTEGFPGLLSPNGNFVNLGSFEEMLWKKSKTGEFDINICFNKSELEINIESTWHKYGKNGLPYLKSIRSNILKRFIHFQDKGNQYEITFKTSLSIYNPLENIKKKMASLKGLIGPFSETVTDSTYEVNDLKISGNIHPADVLSRVGDAIGMDIEVWVFELKSDSKPTFNYIGSHRMPPSRTYYRQSKSDFKLEVSGEGYIDQIIEWEESNSTNYKSLIKIAQELELFNSVKATSFKGGRFELNIKTQKKSNPISMADVGFGISQFLPIIVADLQLSDKSCLAISQPEIHLHPKIQAKFGNYLANQIKQTQKQYIVETHSEYLLNRIRLLLVTGELKPEDVCVLYFENDGIKSTVHNVEFTTKGAVKGAPQGFFDTYEMDVMDIAMHAIG